jgi:hypothetical protein
VLRSYEEKPPKWLDLDNIKYFEHGRGINKLNERYDK